MEGLSFGERRASCHEKSLGSLVTRIVFCRKQPLVEIFPDEGPQRIGFGRHGNSVGTFASSSDSIGCSNVLRVHPENRMLSIAKTNALAVFDL
jgi:hypothetical protein